MGTPKAGTVAVMRNGGTLRLAGFVKWHPGGFINESNNGPAGRASIPQKYQPPYIEIDVTDGPDIVVGELQGETDVEVNALLSNGKNLALEGGAQIGPIEVDTETGNFTLRYEGDSLTEL